MRGYRIEPGEIEAVLATHPDVLAVAVTTYGDGAQRRLVAYVVGDAGSAALREHAAGRLPTFMVPSVFVSLPALPTTANGKLDRAALPAPAPATAWSAPVTATEDLLAGIWAELLGTGAVGAADNFFELGGHSLLATQLVSRVRRTFAVEISLAEVFDHPTVRGLAAVVEAAVTGVALPPVTPVGRDGDLPLSFAQRRLWFLAQLEPESTEYNLPLPPRRLRGPLDVAALGAALSGIVARHEVLRTRLVTGADGTAHQIVEPPRPLPLPVVDVRGVADPTGAVRDLLASEARAGFDLAAGPVLRALLIRTADDEHILGVTVHHVAFDGWSDRIFRRELDALYAGRTLPPLPVQYADYAQWQRRHLDASALEGQLAYWRHRLAALPTLDLPTDRPRPGLRSSAGGVVRLTIPEDVADGLRALARDRGATMFMTLLSAFSVLLGRYCGADDVVVGSPVANRNRAELEGIIGFFVNTLVLRIDLSGDPAFDEVLDRVRRTALDAYAHQDIPFEQLVDALVTERNRARTPLFQVSFDYVTGEPDRPDGPVEGPVDGPAGDVKFDLTVTFGAAGGALAGELHYSTALFDAATIERLADNLVVTLRAVAEDASRPLSQLPVLGAAERDRVVHAWNATGAAVPAVAGAHELVLGHAAARPDTVAVVAGVRSLPYGGLIRRANGLAHRLHAAGAGPGDIVALHLDRDADLVVAILAVWLSGAAYLPLDPDYPADRLRFMLADSGARIVLTGPSAPASLPLEQATALPVAGVPPRDDPPAGPAGGLAYVIYTSGTTGRPKGVHVTHDGLANLAAAMRTVLGSGPATRGLLFASLSFDASVWELVMTLTVGGTLAVASVSDRARPEALPRLLATHGTSLAFLPPSLLRVLDPATVGGLDTLLTGAERLEPAQAAIWSTGHRLLNAYGPTEATVCATIAEIDSGATAGSPPIGTPIANTTVFVLDAGLRPVPVGAPGELYVGGAGVARGYGGRAALTAERFVADPFAADGSRMYRSGDRARWRGDGVLEFLGRVDDQLKVRGFRIEPGEIEAVLTGHPAVAAAVVTVSRERLVAHLVPAAATDGIPPVAELRELLRARLPEYMVPSAFVELSAIPVTANGKTDKAALPEPAAEPAVAYEAPRTEAERILAEVWARCLGLDQVGVEDNFFDLGGDSIIGIQVVALAGEQGLQVTVAQLFDHQTVAALASMAEWRGAAAADYGAVTGPFPLTPIQRWFLGRRLPEPGHFNQSALLETDGPVDPAVLARAVTALLEHHDALRSQFLADGTGVLDVPALLRTGQVGSSEVVWLAGAAPNPELVAAEANRSLNLTAGPVFRVVLFDRPGGGHLLLLVAHHMVVDAISWPILVTDLTSAYEQAEAGVPARLPAKTTSFAAFARRLTELAASDDLAAEAAYWDDVTRARVSLPRDGAGPNMVADAREVRVVLGEEWTTRLLRDVPGVYRTQVNDALLAVLGVVLGPVLVDVEGHGREDVGAGVDVSRTVGWFTSLYPVALVSGSDLGVVLRGMKERLRGVPRRGLGYGLLRYLTDWEPTAVADVTFNHFGHLFEASPDPAAERFRHTVRSMGRTESERTVRAHAIDINSRVVADRLEMVWTYAEGVHERSTVERLANRYLAVLRDLIEHCLLPGAGGNTPSDFPLADLDQAGVDAVTARAGGPVEDVYPLTPLQAGMLFHTRIATERGTNWVQSGVLLGGRLDLAVLRRAWELVFARHEVLRTSVVWDGVPAPLAVVGRAATPPWQEFDLTGHDPDAQRGAVDEWIAADRARGADFTAPVLVRLAVLRLAPDRHQVLLSYHHLQLDGWSLPIVIGEFLDAYRALSTGERPQFVTRRPYRDFVAWSASQDLTEARAYWRERLAGIAGPTSLGVERDTGETGQGAAHATDVPDLTEFARRHRLTVNTVVQGAWAVLLSVYSGETDVVFGATSSGRGGQIAGMEAMVGLLMNTTPVRAVIDPGAPVAQWLRRLQEEQVAARRFEHTPLPVIQACTEVPAGRPLFGSLFVFENYPTRDLPRDDAGPGALRMIVNHADDGREQATNVPLSVIVGANPDLDVMLSYDRGRLDPAAAERIAAHLATLLTAIVEDPDRPVGELSPLAGPERARLLGEWNDSVAEVGFDGGVPALIAARAAAAPDVPAVAHGNRTLTYGALLDRAGRLAQVLRGAGVGPETIVGLCLDEPLDMVAAVLAVWQSGGAYLPLDPAYPPDRLAAVLTDSRAAVLVGLGATVDDLPLGRIRTVLLDDPLTAAGLAALPPGPPPPDLDEPGRLAYVIYTSGSTGTPKGVHVTHGGLANLAAAQRSLFGVGPGDVVLQFASFGFDASVWELVMALAAGAVLRPAGADRAEPGRLAALLTRAGVGVATLPPSLLEVMRPQDVSGVGTLITAGERLDARLARTWGTGRRLFNAYGPTETTVCASVAAVAAADPPPIGGPLLNTRLHILDAALRLVPPGVAGELYVAGDQVVRGYGGRPALTAERFVADPFAGDGGRMYRTGDRVRRRADGQVEFLGRADEQLKVRGVRIEPGEIETALTAHPAVRAAVVTAWGEGADRRLVAYLVPDDPAEGLPPSGQLRATLSRRLPDVMLPAVFVELSTLPLTVNRKIDRRALPAPDSVDAGPADAHAAPITPTEEVLTGIWAQVLGRDRVGATDDFFELGGHSLLATQVASRVAEALGVVLPLAVLFDHPTVRGLADVLDGGGRAALPLVTPSGRDRPLPLSFGQQRLWFLDRLEPGSTDYNVPMQLRWRGPLDRGALERALDALLLRHEVLRTRLVPGADGSAVQVVDPAGGAILAMADVAGAADPEAAGRRLTALDAAAPFDLAAGPLMRALLIRQAADEHVLALTLHHVVCDEWSAGILRRELAALYRGAALPELPVQYADFAIWQRERLAGEVLEGQLAYWRERLADLPVLELPTDRPRPAVRSSAGAVVGFEVPPSIVDGLRSLSRDAGATMFMTLLSAWSLLLARYCGTDDVVVGTPVAGRNRAEIEGLIGFFVNTLVMRTDLSGDPTFGELLGRVRRGALAAYANQDLPFEQLVDTLVSRRDRSRSPLFQVLFNYFVDEDDPGTPGADGPFDGDSVVTQFDLRMVLVDDGARLTGGIEFSTALFDTATVRRMAGHLVTVLGAVAADAALPVSRVPLLAPADRDRVVREWNDTAATAADPAAPDLVAAVAARHPDAVAVSGGGQVLTYAALMARAAGLARHLRGLGTGSETVVGLCVGRGADLPVAVLAVWLAGGAYLPLDPAHPAERLAMMLADSGASVVVASRDAADDLPAGRLPVVVIEDVAAPAPVTVPATLPGQRAYVIYTSGSTGTPKGVHVTHGGLANLIAAQRRVFAAETAARAAVLQFAPHGFDASVWELVLALANGGPLVVATTAERAEPAALARAVRAYGVGLATLPPSLLDVLDPADLAGLGTLVAAGERLETRLAGRWAGRYRLVNAYGPTETTVCATAATVAPDADDAPPIGAPLRNMRVYVLDEHLNPVPPGLPGDLYAAGAQLARGYGGRAALTAQRFVADPFAGDGTRMYCTGDRARWRPDGQVEFLGRADDQLKVRGIRIEAGEIEAALTVHPGVRAAVVTAWGEGAERRLVAYLVPADPADGTPDATVLRAHLSRQLPEFMLPAAYVEVAELPRTRNGKIDRAALPAPGDAPADPATFVAPSTPTERTLSDIWAEILGRGPVGTRDDFFELGGHSLLATRLMSRIRERFGVEIPLTGFFDHPTVAETAVAVNRAKFGIEGDYEEFEL